MYLSGVAIPAINQNGVTSLRLDGSWIFERAPRQLRKRFPGDEVPSLMSPEAILLAVGGVPDPVHE
jgi:hypothetical protein